MHGIGLKHNVQLHSGPPIKKISNFHDWIEMKKKKKMRREELNSKSRQP